MRDVTAIEASPKALVGATVAAAIGAAAVLVLFVLPVETGTDPTGFGSAIGLTRKEAQEEIDPAPMPGIAVAAPAETVAAPSKDTISKTTALRSDEMTIELAPHSGAEIKAHMAAGDSFVFRWDADGGRVKVDMHGERPNAPEDEFSSYWEEKSEASAQGTFTAPFAGTHGWYWRNKGDHPVRVTVRTTGFYKDLFRPEEI